MVGAGNCGVSVATGKPTLGENPHAGRVAIAAPALPLMVSVPDFTRNSKLRVPGGSGVGVAVGTGVGVAVGTGVGVTVGNGVGVDVGTGVTVGVAVGVGVADGLGVAVGIGVPVGAGVGVGVDVGTGVAVGVGVAVGTGVGVGRGGRGRPMQLTINNDAPLIFTEGGSSTVKFWMVRSAVTVYLPLIRLLKM